MNNKYKIFTALAIVIITLGVTFLHLYSHEKTKEIYLAQTEEVILTLKKDLLSDTVNNVLLEMDQLRKGKAEVYQLNTDQRLKRFQEEYDEEEMDFASFFINRFEEDTNENLWTALLWREDTGEILFQTKNLEKKTLHEATEEIGDVLSSVGTVEKGNLRGIFGVATSYIDGVVKEEIAHTIRTRTFSNESYIWVNEILNYEGGENYAIRRVHPNLVDTEGMYLSTEMEDLKGKKPYLEELEGVKSSGEHYFTYSFKKLNSEEVSEKLTFAKLYEDFDWIVAMGVHFDDIDLYTQEVGKRMETLTSEWVFRLLLYIGGVLLVGFSVLYVIDKKHLHSSTKSLQNEVNMDLLTKASSRRSGVNHLSAFFQMYQTTLESPTLMMFDIDDFKIINDTYGHGVGDEVLMAISITVQHMIRSSDQFIRWGGDEFVGILPGLKEEQVISFGKEIAQAVSEISILAKDHEVRFTISMGFTFFKESDGSYEDALKRVDEALYISKKKGKNQVTFLK
ncbi:MAG TPA: diguanylate cyclase [Clostridiaceae bacterium]|nr:diguanylate cyclase [Clostridiaceae bacterium]